jgi:hypothetical protein
MKRKRVEVIDEEIRKKREKNCDVDNADSKIEF